MRLWRHMRGLWPRHTLLPPLIFVVAAVVAYVRGVLRWDHIAIVVLVAALAYTNRTTKRLCIGLYPIGLVAVLYDAMKSIQNVGVTPERVHLCGLRATEIRWFGITMDGSRTTVHDWLQAHATLPLDVLCSIPYGTFIFASLAAAVYLYFRDFAAMQRFMWTFFLMNVMGFLTYHLYPAAPPWYYHAHGCTVDMLARPSEGPNLARVDQLLGVQYFTAMYGRSSDVFGAIPSLHVAYPLLIALETWRHVSRPLRVTTVAYSVLMAFAAIYLDHHWIIDALVGVAYCLIAVLVVRSVQRWHATNLAKESRLSGTHGAEWGESASESK